jgi:hypothetical protein
LLTRVTEDLQLKKIANLDDEYDVDFVDFGIMTKHRIEGKRE